MLCEFNSKIRILPSNITSHGFVILPMLSLEHIYRIFKRYQISFSFMKHMYYGNTIQFKHDYWWVSGNLAILHCIISHNSVDSWIHVFPTVFFHFRRDSRAHLCLPHCLDAGKIKDSDMKFWVRILVIFSISKHGSRFSNTSYTFRVQKSIHKVNLSGVVSFAYMLFRATLFTSLI